MSTYPSPRSLIMNGNRYEFSNGRIEPTSPSAPQPDTLMANLLGRALDLCVQVGVIQSSSCHMNGCWVSGKGPMSFEETARYLADLISSKGSSEKMAQWPTYQEELLDTMSRIGEHMMEKRNGHGS